MRLGKLTLSAKVLAVIIVLIVAGISLPLIFIDLRTVAIDDVMSVGPDGSGRLDLRVEATVGELEVIFRPLGNEAVMVRSMVEGKANVFGDGSPLKVNVTSSSAADAMGSVQAVNVTLNTYAPWPHYSIRKVNYTITIDEGLRTGLNLSVRTGGISLATAAGVVIEGLELNSTAKGAAVSFANGTVLAGDVRIQTATGGSNLSWDNVTVLGARNIALLESSGPITAMFSQSSPMGGSVRMRVVDAVGEVRLGFDLAGQASARITCGWNPGTPEVTDLGGFSGTPENFLSDNYPGGSSFRVQVNQTLGNIRVDGRWAA